MAVEGTYGEKEDEVQHVDVSRVCRRIFETAFLLCASEYNTTLYTNCVPYFCQPNS
jgi:hypothetical protein